MTLDWQTVLICYLIVGIGVAELGGARLRRGAVFLYIFMILFWAPVIILTHLFGEDPPNG